ncbi:MAG: hypothetical protein U0X92_10710 [Anaerolineales bacterium]
MVARPADYYPHAGDPVAPLGFTAASNGDDYWKGVELDEGETSHAVHQPPQRVQFQRQAESTYNAISGDRMIVLQGQPVSGFGTTPRSIRARRLLNKNDAMRISLL